MKVTASPRQARAQLTKEKLLTAALEMYVKQGYHNTTVDEIAAHAGLSTGIAYRYFRNKKDILLSAIIYTFENIGSFAGLQENDAPTDRRGYIGYVLDRFEELHIKYNALHEELEGLRHTDEDVRLLYNDIESKALDEIAAKLSAEKGGGNIREKVYFAFGVMEQYCHRITDEAFSTLDGDCLREMTIETVMSLGL